MTLSGRAPHPTTAKATSPNAAAETGAATGTITGRDHHHALRDGQDGSAIIFTKHLQPSATQPGAPTTSGPTVTAVIVTDGCSSGRASEVGARLGARWLAELITHEAMRAMRATRATTPLARSTREADMPPSGASREADMPPGGASHKADASHRDLSREADASHRDLSHEADASHRDLSHEADASHRDLSREADASHRDLSREATRRETTIARDVRVSPAVDLTNTRDAIGGTTARDASRRVNGLQFETCGSSGVSSDCGSAFDPSRVTRGLIERLRVLATSSGSGEIDQELIADMLLFTFLAVVVTSTEAERDGALEHETIVFGVGDGMCWIDGDVTTIDPGPSNAPDYAAYALLGKSIDPRILFRSSSTRPPKHIAIATDGAQSLFDKDPSAFRELITEDRIFSNPSLLRKRMLVLAERDREIFWDDTTIGVLRCGEKTVGRL